MKKINMIILMLAAVLYISGCAESEAPLSETSTVPEVTATACYGTEAETFVIGVDIDLTELSNTMIYGEVFNMMYTPSDYVGKTVTMHGNFAIYEDESTGSRYFSCVIADATACCEQGLEFVLAGDFAYPDDYPEIGSEITVTGVFEMYEESGYSYCHLVDAVIE